MQRFLASFAIASLAALAMSAGAPAQNSGNQSPGNQNPGNQNSGNPDPVAPAAGQGEPATQGAPASQGDPAPQPAQQPAAQVVEHVFGTPGEPGSFRVVFSTQGAGVMFVQMLDHYVSVAAARRETHDKQDWLLLVWSGNDHSLRLSAPAAAGLGVQPAAAIWQHEITAENAVHFWLDAANGLRLHKTFYGRPDQRGLGLRLGIENRGQGQAGVLPLDLVGPTVVNATEASLFGNPAVAIAAGPPDTDPAIVHPDPGQPPQSLMTFPAGGFAMSGSTNRFFGAFVYPLGDGAQQAVADIDVVTIPGLADPVIGVTAPTTRTVLGLQLPIPAAGASSQIDYGIYLGPKSYEVFDDDPEFARFEPIMDVDLEPPCCGSVTVPGGRPMAKLLLLLLGWFENFVGNWGIAIMMLTVLVRGLLAPLNYRMQKSMREYGKRMAVLKPKLDELQKRHANDKQAYQQAMLQLQREHKLLPPLGGCLPIFLTMPVYIGLFTALRVAYDLRHESFLYISDLSQPDQLFLLPFWPHNFNLLPLLWIVLLWLMQRKMPLPTDPQQRQVQQIMRYMPMVFGVLLYNYAAGLMVYMVTSMLWTHVESAIIRSKLGPMDPSVAGMAPAPVM